MSPSHRPSWTATLCWGRFSRALQSKQRAQPHFHLPVTAKQQLWLQVGAGTLAVLLSCSASRQANAQSGSVGRGRVQQTVPVPLEAVKKPSSVVFLNDTDAFMFSLSSCGCCAVTASLQHCLAVVVNRGQMLINHLLPGPLYYLEKPLKF